ncbi:MAG: hypothetical protein V1703_00540 [Candidatus Altiarchaeota archaeon]
MSPIERLLDYKRQYEEMDPYRRNQLNLTVIGSIILIIALYLIMNSIEGIRSIFGK